jgi:membrane protease subunit (stomatin/prohibitin family)
LDNHLTALLTSLTKELQPPYKVQITNWPDSIRLRPLVTQLYQIHDILAKHLSQLPTKDDVDDANRRLLSELDQMLQMLKEVNSKGSFINSKTK